ncbi:MAG: hypothetical protein ACK5KU_01790 [Beutenbergiaceae bacterium]
MSQPADPGDGEPTSDEIDKRFAELTADLVPDLPDGVDPAPRIGETPPEPGAGPRDYRLAPEPDEGFVPAEPEPLSGIDPLQFASWAGAVGGPVAMVLLMVLWPGTPMFVWLTALAATLTGWGVIIWRLPRERADPDDDGAVL